MWARQLQGILALDDFEAAARRHLPRSIFGYVAGGTETNRTLRDNRSAFEELLFLPRVLVDVSNRSQKTTIFGRQYAAPFGIAPMGISALTAYRGDLAQAKAAAQADIPMIMSGSSLIRLEDIAAAAPESWFQAYLPGDPSRIALLVERVKDAGFGTLVVTVDSQVTPNRENNVRAGFKTPLQPSLRLLWEGVSHPRWTIGTFLRTFIQHGMPHFENNDAARGAPILSRNVARDFSGREHTSWNDVRRIREQWTGKLILKGIMNPQDAMAARDAGFDGIILSNHGGRQLDGAASPMRVLSAVKSAVAGIPIMIDSGFRRGTDVLKAFALGADFVFVGRPFNYAATIAGEAGVLHAIGLLSAEIHADMGLLGINNLDELGPDWLLGATDHLASR